MVIKQNQFAYNSCLEQIKNDSKSDLKPFVNHYIKTHSFAKPKNIALDYLEQKYNLTFYDNSSYNFLINPLTNKIGKLLAFHLEKGLIQKFNSITYQVINRKQPRIERIL